VTAVPLAFSLSIYCIVLKYLQSYFLDEKYGYSRLERTLLPNDALPLTSAAVILHVLGPMRWSSNLATRSRDDWRHKNCRCSSTIRSTAVHSMLFSDQLW